MLYRTIIVLIILAVTAIEVVAQSKFFSTSSREGVEGAKQNAQLTKLQRENE